MTDIKKVRPWDLFNAKKPKLTKQSAQERFLICQGCEHFLKTTGQCKKCGCFMKLKTTLEEAVCPVGKW